MVRTEISFLPVPKAEIFCEKQTNICSIDRLNSLCFLFLDLFSLKMPCFVRNFGLGEFLENEKFSVLNLQIPDSNIPKLRILPGWNALKMHAIASIKWEVSYWRKTVSNLIIHRSGFICKCIKEIMHTYTKALMHWYTIVIMHLCTITLLSQCINAVIF